jgi:hypothetical protein
MSWAGALDKTGVRSRRLACWSANSQGNAADDGTEAVYVLMPSTPQRRAADQARVEVPHLSAAVPGAGVVALHPVGGAIGAATIQVEHVMPQK